MPSRKPFYGWIIAVELAFSQVISWGVVYFAFSVVLTPMEATFGWTRDQLTGAFSMALLISGVVGLPVGWWLDRHGARLLMSLGSLLTGLLLLAWSAVETIEAYYAVWALIGVMMAFILYDPAFVLLAKWFHHKRGTAIALVTLAAGFASTIFLPLTDWLTQQMGWRGAVAVLALTMIVIVAPAHALILRRRPEDQGLLPDGEPQPQPGDSAVALPPSVSVGAALRDSTFWLLTIGFAMSLLASNAMRVHLIPYLIEQGYQANYAAWVGAITGVTQVIGRLVYLPLESRFSLRNLAISLMILQAAAYGLLLIGNTPLLIWLFVFFYGATLGMITLVRPALTAGTYGAASFGRINSVMAFIMTLAITAGPVGAGIIYERMGGYFPAVVLAIIITAIGVAVLLRVPQSTLNLSVSWQPDTSKISENMAE
jgi:MFS family permease